MAHGPTPIKHPAPPGSGRPGSVASRFDAVIFDMDGVIVDSEPLHERAFLDVFEEMGYGETHGIHFPDYYGCSDQALWTDFVARHRPPQPMATLIRRKQDRLLALLREHRPVLPGVVALLERLAPRYKLALASGSPREVIDLVLAMEGLRRFFPVVVSVQDVAKPKPAPDVFRYTAERLGMAASRCCVIEDAAYGVEAARAAGMTVVAITNSLPAGKLARADRVVHGYAEIAAWLAR